MYIIKKAKEYFFPIIQEEDYIEAMTFLDAQEKKFFLEMAEYDKKHSIEVYKKVSKNEILKDKILYKKLALLHDCGKNKAGIILRILHKLNVKTKLEKHPEQGSEKLQNINGELSLLIKNHHRKNYSSLMNEFQKLDDLS